MTKLTLLPRGFSGFVVPLLLAAILICGTPQAHADFIPAMDYAPGGSVIEVGTGTGSGVTLGYAFTVGAAPVTIDALGLATNSFFGATFGGVRVYQLGTTSNVASANVSTTPVSSPSGLGHTYTYTAITPTVLNAATTYAIVWDTSYSTASANYNSSAVSNNADITYASSIGGYSENGLYPTTDSISTGPYFGPSFELAAVPEPASLALSGSALALAGAGWWTRKRKQNTAAPDAV